MNSNVPKMKVVIHGGKPATPEVVTLKKKANRGKELMKYVTTHDYKQPLLLHWPVGSGKTHAIKTELLPWLMENGYRGCYVSSRSAINLQFKHDTLTTVGEAHLLDELTEEGLRKLEHIGPLDVYTFHKLYNLMVHSPGELNGYNVFIFDEVHALLDDALFVGCTGTVLEQIPIIFGGCQRIYMSATPEAILPHLAAAEAPNAITVMRLPCDYHYVRPYFFSSISQIVDKINNDLTEDKWLALIPSIKSGKAFAEQLEFPSCLLNTEERDLNPEIWNQVLREEKFDDKVCIVTAIVDAGVNLKDPLLKNIVACSIWPSKIVQILGRKRREPDEEVNLYIYCPSLSSLMHRLAENTEKWGILKSFFDHTVAFIRNHILTPERFDFRGLMDLKKDGRMEPNKLAIKNLEYEISLIEKIIKRAKETKDPYVFDRFVCRWLRIPVPDRKISWLDNKANGTAQNAFTKFLAEHLEISMQEEVFQAFSKEFQRLCIAAFGKGSNDRDDRTWKTLKINRKFKELKLPYQVCEDKKNKTYTLQAIIPNGTQRNE